MQQLDDWFKASMVILLTIMLALAYAAFGPLPNRYKRDAHRFKVARRRDKRNRISK